LEHPLDLLAHEVEDVSELLFLGSEILEVLVVGCDLQGQPFDDGETVSLDARALAGVVGDDAHLSDAEVEEDLRADAVVAKIRGEAEPLVRLDNPGARRP
jgi:hypothetical protein